MFKGAGGEFGPIHKSCLGFPQQEGKVRASPSQDAEGVRANPGPLPGERKGVVTAIKLAQVLKTPWERPWSPKVC